MTPTCIFTGPDCNYEHKIREYTYWYHVEVPNIGHYWTSDELYRKRNQIDKKTKLNCISETIKLNESKITPVWAHEDNDCIRDALKKIFNNNYVLKIIKDFENIPINHSKKSIQLLHAIAKKANDSNSISNEIIFSKKDLYKLLESPKFSSLSF